MPTTVVSTIGTAGTYTTLQSWEDACPADLVAADQIWQGQVKNQEFVGTATLLTIAGQTTDSTRYIELTTEAGASFVDNANKLTNALRYNASNGAAIRKTTSYSGVVIAVNTNYTRISKLQLSSTPSYGFAISLSGTNCIIENMLSVAHMTCYSLYGANCQAINCLAICTSSFRNDCGGFFFQTGSNMVMYNCTSVLYSGVVSGGGAAAYRCSYSSNAILKNCAGFGFVNFTYGQPLSASCSHNASDQTIAYGSSNQPSLTYADQFENAVSGTADFRVKSGATLISNGTDLSGSGVTTDIVGTPRSVPYTIGAWQVVSSSGPSRRRYYIV